MCGDEEGFIEEDPPKQVSADPTSPPELKVAGSVLYIIVPHVPGNTSRFNSTVIRPMHL